MKRRFLFILFFTHLALKVAYAQPTVFDSRVSHTNSAPIIQVQPPSHDYKEVAVNSSSADMAFTITNVGDTVLIVSETTLAGDDPNEFDIVAGKIESANPVTLTANQSHKFRARFNPTSRGLKTAKVRISSNDKQVDVTLQGVGDLGPMIQLTPDMPLVFALTDTSKTFSIKNTGEILLEWQALPSQSWITVTPAAGSLLPNQSIEVRVKINRKGLCTATRTEKIVVRGQPGVASKEIGLNIEILNPPPVALLDKNDVAIILNDVKKSLVVDLAPIFRDGNGDNLDYFFAENTDSAKASATLSDDKRFLTITSKASGTTKITVGATDRCDTALVTFSVLINQGPKIVHAPLPAQPFGAAILVQVTIANDQEGTTAALHYRRGGDAGFKRVDMRSNPDGVYAATIPKDSVTSRGIEYFFTARNDVDSTSLPVAPGFYSIRVRVGGNGESKRSAQPSGNAQSGYRLVSAPMQLEEASPQAVLADDLGSYDDKKWRFFELVENYLSVPADQSIYRELGEVPAMKTGIAYWLLVKDAGKVIDTGAGVSIRTDSVYSIAFQPGWNFVGSPFTFPMPFEKLSLQSGRQLDIRFYNGAFVPAISPMQPFEGYLVANNSTAGDRLLIDPILSPRTTSLPKAIDLPYRQNAKWFIQILANCQEARDVDNAAVAIPEASSDWDNYDRPEPLVIGEYVAVYFPHPEWGKVFKAYTTDARPEPSDGEIWDFEVRTNIRDRVRLTFANLASVPGEFEVWVMDQTLNLSHNLRESNNYVIAGTEHPKRLQLVVGKRGFVAEKRATVERTPVAYELSQNFPNPFNPSTTIRYGLPREERVALTIYNTLGEEVLTLIEDEMQKAGYHAAIWDGRNRAGQVAASGVYIYKLRAGSFTSIKKMALVR
jgi:hypothetical protein